MPLLHVHRATRRGRGLKQIGLARQKRGDLEGVYDRCDLNRLLRKMDISDQREAAPVTYSIERGQSGRQAGTPRRPG